MMPHWPVVVLTLIVAMPSPSLAQSLRREEKGTFMGALFAPVPEALYEHLSQLPRNQGVLLTHVLPDSPAARAALRRHDVVLQYDDTKVRDCEHFVSLIRADRPGRTVKLLLVRSGRQTEASVALAEGPALKIAQAAPSAPESRAKSPAPAVSVAATPLVDGKMKVTIAYYSQGDTGKLRTVTCQGENADIDTEVQKLPERERSLVRAALQRIRDFSSKK
jgi:hypothetical protein